MCPENDFREAAPIKVRIEVNRYCYIIVKTIIYNDFFVVNIIIFDIIPSNGLSYNENIVYLPCNESSIESIRNVNQSSCFEFQGLRT